MLSFGINAFFTPARSAAINFSFNPPIGMTLPLNETSPVMAIFPETFLFVNKEASAVVIVIPALGPSFGTAPSGT